MKKIITPIVSALALIGIDQLTKYLARVNLASGSVPIIDGFFELTLVHNKGAAFGVLQGKLWLFYIFTAIILTALVYAYIKVLQEPKFKILRILAVFIFAGAIGNLIDRLVFGYVTDFFSLVIINFPVFNMADIFVSWSMVLGIILLLFKYKDSDFKKSDKEVRDDA